MAVNSSSSSFSFVYHCSDTTSAIFTSMVFVITHVLVILPFSLLVLYVGCQRWWQQRSFESASHSDIFTYHFAVIELIFGLGFSLYSCGEHLGLVDLMIVGFIAMSVLLPGQMSFHVLICVERYLAVVHPIIYLGLRQSGGVRIRNISIGCAWLMYCGWIGITALYIPTLPYIAMFCFLVLFLVVVSFCSISVLCVLIRPGPGEMGVNRRRVDQSKQRAFHTVTAITAVLWLYFFGLLASLALDNSDLLNYNNRCLALVSGSCFGLPSSLALPLLFLQRAGKLFFLHCSNEKRSLLH